MNLKTGECDTCPSYYKEVDGKCIMPECSEDRQFITVNGECDICPKYTNPSEDKKKCVKATCSDRELAQEDGSCKECPINTRA